MFHISRASRTALGAGRVLPLLLLEPAQLGTESFDGVQLFQSFGLRIACQVLWLPELEPLDLLGHPHKLFIGRLLPFSLTALRCLTAPILLVTAFLRVFAQNHRRCCGCRNFCCYWQLCQVWLERKCLAARLLLGACLLVEPFHGTLLLLALGGGINLQRDTSRQSGAEVGAAIAGHAGALAARLQRGWRREGCAQRTTIDCFVKAHADLDSVLPVRHSVGTKLMSSYV